VFLHTVVPGTVVVLLVLFVLWGVRTSPHGPFSWGMYSGSSKGFLWTAAEPDGRRRPVCHRELGLVPEGHFLTVTELHRLLRATEPQLPFDGLIIGSAGEWRIRYVSDEGNEGDEGDEGGEAEGRGRAAGRLYAARLTPGTGHARLIAALRELR
jgi:hypothetical protein